MGCVVQSAGDLTPQPAAEGSISSILFQRKARSKVQEEPTELDRIMAVLAEIEARTGSARVSPSMSQQVAALTCADSI